jgi:hypothetical protein
MNENEELTSSYATSEPSFYNASYHPTANTGNVHGATLTEGENCVNMLKFSTNHTLIEQFIMEPSLALSLSHGDLLVVSCDKDAWCITTSVLHASAENKLVLHVASKSDELHLLSSLHNLCYIEFDNLCNLDCLEERIFAYADLPRLSKYSYHVIGKYNNKGQYMVHRVYICTHMSSPFVVQDCDRLEGNHHTTTFPCSSRSFVLNKTVDFQEGQHHWFLPSIPALSFVGTNLLQDSVIKHFVSSAHDAYMLAKFSMQDDIFTNWKHGDIPPHNNFDFLCFRNPVLSCVVQDRFQVQSTPRTAFRQEGENDEDMATMLMSMCGAWIGDDRVQQGFPSQEGGPRLIRFESPRWRPKAIQVRAQFGVQEQCAIKWTPRSHAESVLVVLYMVGSTIL